MIGISIFILELFVLYFLSKKFIQKLFINIYRLVHDKEKAAVILGWIFLPGTFVHEISHFITALFLIVPVGRINLMPEIIDNGIKLGSAEVGKTDFIRGSIIGLAPLIFGGGITLYLVYFIISSGNTNIWTVLVLVFLIFELSNTMFSSKKDLVSVLELVVFMAIISLAMIYFKIYTPFIFIYHQLSKAVLAVEVFSFYLTIPILIELLLLFV